jgi:hypothetical protein
MARVRRNWTPLIWLLDQANYTYIFLRVSAYAKLELWNLISFTIRALPLPTDYSLF